MPQFQKDHGYCSHRRRQRTDAFMRHVLTFSLACCWLVAPAMAAELEACRNLLDQRNVLYGGWSQAGPASRWADAAVAGSGVPPAALINTRRAPGAARPLTLK